MSLRRLKIVLIGPTCDGTDVGEAWSTYQWAYGLSAQHDVTLLTYRKRNRPSAVPQLPNTEVIEWLDLPLVGRFERFNAMVKPGYFRFYLHARRWLLKAVSSGRRFDIVHQVAPLALRYPCPAVGLGLPIVLGPIAGSLNTPATFRHDTNSDPWFVQLRWLDRWRFRYDPWLRASFQQASVIIGVAPYVRNLLEDVHVRRFVTCSETGVIQLPPRKAEGNHASTLKLLYVGRIIRTKGLRDTIRALGLLRADFDWHLDVLGDGPDRSRCQQECEQLKLTDRIVFHGRVPRKEVDTFYRQADVFVFPSFREPSGNVVIEAMSHGLPCIVSDRGGPAEAITNDCGFRIPIYNPQQYASEIAGAIRLLAQNFELRNEMGRNARERVRDVFLWPRKIEWISNLYQELLDNCAICRDPEATALEAFTMQ